MQNRHYVCAIAVNNQPAFEEDSSTMSRRRQMLPNAEYHRVPTDDSGFIDAQFEVPKVEIPWKAITLASLLCIGGTVLLVIGSLIITGHIDVKYADRTWPLLILGALMFLPGAYHVRIAYCAFRSYPGYSFSDIPEFE